jgi:hypothetical protein
MIDEDRAGFHRTECAIGFDRHLPKVVVVADAGENDLLPPGGFRGNRGSTAAMLGNPLLGLSRGPVYRP